MIITDEMVEKAYEATLAEHSGRWPSSVVRTIIEAVAPLLITQSHKERCKEQRHYYKLMTEQSPFVIYSICKWCGHEARAQELDPQ